MSFKPPRFVVPLLLSLPAIGHGAPAEPSNYDECIVDTMRGVSSDVAARAIMESCRKLYPEPVEDVLPQDTSAAPPAATAPPVMQRAVEDVRELTADELGRLGSRAKVFGSRYRVTIDNENPDLMLTEVTIAVWDDGNPVASREEYSEAVRIAPQASALVKYTVHYRGEETGWNWAVVGARGAPAPE